MNKVFKLPCVDDANLQPAANQPKRLRANAISVADGAKQNAAALDHDQAFPAADIQALAEADLLSAPLPTAYGGVALGSRAETASDLAHILMTIGGGSLPLGRLYEGHVNAIRLITEYGTPEQIALMAVRVQQHALFAVWNTESSDGVRLLADGAGKYLSGRKIFASGAGQVVYPLITARNGDGRLLMVIPTVAGLERADLSTWTAHGMRASASGAVDFTGLRIDDVDIIGGPDDFLRQPLFSTGAWRFAAVQTGGIGTVFDVAREHLQKVGRIDDPHQRARMGQAALAIQSARQWVLEAAAIADDDLLGSAARIAHVNLARTAVERAGLDVLELAQRSVGLAGFSRQHPLEKLARDLATYLRQPNPDKALGDAAAFVLGDETPILEMWTCQ